MGHENGGWMNSDQRDAMKEAARLAETPEPMTVATHGPEAPKTHGEARFFHDGFLAGATAYAAAVGHSCLKSNNPKLCEVFDAQGWRTIELFEKLAEAVLVCEHGVKDGDWCEPCNKEMKNAAREQLEGYNCSAGFCGGLVGRPTHPDEVAKPIRDEIKRIMQPVLCERCDMPLVPGQPCPECQPKARREAADKQSYDDLAASGGIVDAP